MSETAAADAHLIDLRRDLHRHPEPAWREFYTTARIVEEVERVGVDELFVGREVAGGGPYVRPRRRGTPPLVRARGGGGANEDTLARIEGGYTGAVAVLDTGDSPTVGLRVDIDALPREESDDPDHDPAAEMHLCDASIETEGYTPNGESDGELGSIVADVARGVAVVDAVLDRDELGGSEDATFLMRRVQDVGGLACYVGIGTDHPGGHHTVTFDVDEESIRIGVEVLAGAIQEIARGRPQAGG